MTTTTLLSSHSVAFQGGEVFRNDPLFLAGNGPSYLDVKGLEGQNRTFQSGLFNGEGGLLRPAKTSFSIHTPGEQENGLFAADRAIAPVAGIGVRFTIHHPETDSLPSTVWLHQRKNGNREQDEKFISTHRLIPLQERKHLLSEIRGILEKHGVPVKRACITNANFHEEDMLERTNAEGKSHHSKQEILDMSKERGQNQLYVDFLAPPGSERAISAALQEIQAIQRSAGFGGQRR